MQTIGIRCTQRIHIPRGYIYTTIMVQLWLRVLGLGFKALFSPLHLGPIQGRLDRECHGIQARVSRAELCLFFGFA